MAGDEFYDDDVTSGPLPMDGTYADDMETWLTSCKCDHLNHHERGCLGCPSHSQDAWAKSLAGPVKVTFVDPVDALGRPLMKDPASGLAFVDEGDDCTRCGGDGFEECDDFIQCMKRYHIGDEHECSACGGSGLTEDQEVW